ncbi:MAG: hypothetical protein AAF730_05400 [Bacteroidota bacterium]
MFTSATPLLTTFARPDHALLAHAQLMPERLTVRHLSWRGVRTEQIDLSTLQGVEYFSESPRETGLTFYLHDGTSLTLRMKAARLWLLTLADAAPQLKHQGAVDPVRFDEPLPEVQPLIVPATADDSEAENPLHTDTLRPAQPIEQADALEVAVQPAPRQAGPEFSLGDGWTADRMTHTLHKLSDAETDRRSQALLRSLDWADA